MGNTRQCASCTFGCALLHGLEELMSPVERTVCGVRYLSSVGEIGWEWLILSKWRHDSGMFWPNYYSDN